MNLIPFLLTFEAASQTASKSSKFRVIEFTNILRIQSCMLSTTVLYTRGCSFDCVFLMQSELDIRRYHAYYKRRYRSRRLDMDVDKQQKSTQISTNHVKLITIHAIFLLTFRKYLIISVIKLRQFRNYKIT